MRHSLVDVLREVKPHRSLFTSFTFNPAFFEATILREAFRPDGCQVHVLVDAGRLAASTVGSYAQHVGTRYSIAPITAPGGGIFHPKIALLDGKERQVLCVGSGNLTASGLARQVECLDIADLAEEKELAAQLRAFLLLLADQCRQTSPRGADMLDSAAGWLANDPSPTRSTSKATLIHTLERSASEEMHALLRREGGRTLQLTVLAPFHSRDGAAVTALRRSVGAQTLRIAHLGVSPCDEEAYEDITFVSPPQRPPRRPLHAKIFEFQTDNGTWVATGSVNATWQSLQSLKNVEASVARWGQKSPFTWQESQPASFSPHEESFEPAPSWVMEAVLVGSCRLEALVLGADAAGAEVTWALIGASELAHGSAKLDPEGLMRTDVAKPLSTTHEGLVLHVRGSLGQEARAWVNDQRAITITRQGTPLGRGSTDGSRVDLDYSAAANLLLQALHGHEVKYSPDSDRASSTYSSQQQARALLAADEAFDYSSWIRSGRLRLQLGATSIRRQAGFYWRILDLLMPRPDNDVDEAADAHDGAPLLNAESHDEDDEPRHEGERRESTTRQQSVRKDAQREELLKACEAVREAFEAGREGIASAALLCMAVCAVDIERAQRQFLIGNRGDARAFDAHRVLVLWLDYVSRYRFEAQTRDDLLPFLTAVAAAAASIPGSGDPQERHLSQLRGSIYRLASVPLSHRAVLDLVAQGMDNELLLRLHPSFRAATIASASALAEAKPIDDLILQAIAARPPSNPALPSAGSALPLLSAALGRSNRIGVVRIDQLRSGGCHICYKHFDNSERKELTYCRWIMHWRETPHVLVLPDEVARFATYDSGRLL